MEKEEILQKTGFKVCHVCGKVYAKNGKTLECLSYYRADKEDGVPSKKYDFCEEHSPIFRCDIALGDFSWKWKDRLLCFYWGENRWCQVDPEAVRKWLDKIYPTQ